MNNRWQEILGELERLYKAEAEARRVVNVHYRPVSPKEMGFEAVLAETRLRSVGCDEEISRSISAWAWGMPLTGVSDEAQMWRYARIHAALMWLSMAVGVPGWGKVLTSPQLSDADVIRWLLTDWWQIGGIQFRAMYEMGT